MKSLTRHHEGLLLVIEGNESTCMQRVRRLAREGRVVRLMGEGAGSFRAFEMDQILTKLLGRFWQRLYLAFCRNKVDTAVMIARYIDSVAKVDGIFPGHIVGMEGDKPRGLSCLDPVDRRVVVVFASDDPYVVPPNLNPCA